MKKLVAVVLATGGFLAACGGGGGEEESTVVQDTTTVTPAAAPPPSGTGVTVTGDTNGAATGTAQTDTSSGSPGYQPVRDESEKDSLPRSGQPGAP